MKINRCVFHFLINTFYLNVGIVFVYTFISIHITFSDNFICQLLSIIYLQMLTYMVTYSYMGIHIFHVRVGMQIYSYSY